MPLCCLEYGIASRCRDFPSGWICDGDVIDAPCIAIVSYFLLVAFLISITDCLDVLYYGLFVVVAHQLEIDPFVVK